MPNKKTKKAPKLIRFNAAKQHIIDKLKMRSSDESIESFITVLTQTAHTILKEAGTFSKKDKRTTILKEDLQKAIENNLSKGNLSWQETAQEIIKKNPTQLSSISKVINEHIQKKEK